jgi:hypothetical protein
MDWIDEARKEREAQHGPISPMTDPRCFLREAVEELLDSLNYAEWSYRKGEINTKRWRWLNSDLRRAIAVIYFTCENRWQVRLERFTRGFDYV